MLRLNAVNIKRDINEEYHCNGEKAYIQGVRFLHYPFTNGVNWWFARHNRYSDMEAMRLLKERTEAIRWRDLDGQAGFHYSVLRSIYEYMIDLKMLEQKRLKAGKSI